ncbi:MULTISPECIES: RloB family protein [unclassified Oceanispirochaeta]|uniref:RloB family protein n=1 Tax=unclassified Oceanispirochaeta TaxID=2635722 RepID=UPI000E098509|nr:RloB domain-containing protein [Oceanispirochaeta sp. M2]NPD75526.1 RloB domain-containing protein [Oceanispirochaeta sp. M1]RDG28617.1 RloB domain-containing protein [Oceanispirochaeta sp. M1]
MSFGLCRGSLFCSFSVLSKTVSISSIQVNALYFLVATIASFLSVFWFSSLQFPHKDDFSDSDFNTAITNAESYGFKVAYSNQAFEYWLILHFNDHQGGSIHRDSYNSIINK